MQFVSQHIGGDDEVVHEFSLIFFCHISLKVLKEDNAIVYKHLHNMEITSNLKIQLMTNTYLSKNLKKKISIICSK